MAALKKTKGTEAKNERTHPHPTGARVLTVVSYKRHGVSHETAWRAPGRKAFSCFILKHSIFVCYGLKIAVKRLINIIVTF
jgi:hypothetical protein